MIAPIKGVWERLQGVYDREGRFILHGPDGAAVNFQARWEAPKGLSREQAAWIRFSWGDAVYDGAVFVREPVGDGLFAAQIQARRVR